MKKSRAFAVKVVGIKGGLLNTPPKMRLYTFTPISMTKITPDFRSLYE